jgi:hypothetical protein
MRSRHTRLCWAAPTSSTPRIRCVAPWGQLLPVRCGPYARQFQSRFRSVPRSVKFGSRRRCRPFLMGSTFRSPSSSWGFGARCGTAGGACPRRSITRHDCREAGWSSSPLRIPGVDGLSLAEMADLALRTGAQGLLVDTARKPGTLFDFCTRGNCRISGRAAGGSASGGWKSQERAHCGRD